MDNYGVVVLAELSRIRSELGRIRWNAVEYGGKWQIAVDCGNLVVGLLDC